MLRRLEQLWHFAKCSNVIKIFSFFQLSGDVRVIITFFLTTSPHPTTESFPSSRFLDSRKSWVQTLITTSPSCYPRNAHVPLTCQPSMLIWSVSSPKLAYKNHELTNFTFYASWTFKCSSYSSSNNLQPKPILSFPLPTFNINDNLKQSP